jgi:predicted RNase H-like HicB family nuclease
MEGNLRIRIEYEQGDDGWVVASIPAVPGAHSQGRNRDEARDNVLDALQLLLSPEPDAGGGEADSVELTVVR